MRPFPLKCWDAEGDFVSVGIQKCALRKNIGNRTLQQILNGPSLRVGIVYEIGLFKLVGFLLRSFFTVSLVSCGGASERHSSVASSKLKATKSPLTSGGSLLFFRIVLLLVFSPVGQANT